MPNYRRLAYSLLFLCFVIASAGCASADVVSPDAAVEISPTGEFSLHSSFVIADPPPTAVVVLADLSAATDGVDDPARYLVDRLVARLPEGRARQYAESLAPYFAAYLETKLDAIAPRFSVGIRDLVEGLDHIAHRVETSEHITIYADGTARREVEGLRWGPDAVDFAEIDAVMTTVALTPVGDGHRVGGPMPDEDRAGRSEAYERVLTFDEHTLRVPYGAMLRAGFDHAIIPRIVPRTFTLASALTQLVDCPRLGALTAEWMGIGSPDFYATGCTTAMTALAAQIYARISALDADPLTLELSGVARAFDRDADGAIDRIEGGRWVGTFGTATFDGKRR